MTAQEMMKKFHIAEAHEPGFRPEAPYELSYEAVHRDLEQYADVNEVWRLAAKYLAGIIHSKVSEPKAQPGIFVPVKRDSEYSLVTKAKPRGDEPEYLSYPTRNVDTLTDYDRCGTGDIPLDRWGGAADQTCQATGFFHMEFHSGRHIMIDPDGHPCYMAGISAVSPSMSPNAKANAIQKYGSLEKWASTTIDRTKELGFVTAGMWSDNQTLHATGKPFGLCGTGYFVTTYAERCGRTEAGVGHCLFSGNNTIPVFDPAFEKFAGEYAQEIAAPHAQEEDIVGWFSDNELPTMLNTLERCLTLNPADSANLYTLAVAWTYLRQATGKSNPTLDDVTVEMLEEFRGIVYERYFQVVSTALKQADPNHLYLGCRFSYLGKSYRDGTALSEPILRAAGHWCDIVSINYYFAWEPDAEVIRDWIAWSGKPFMISEWYAMSVDSGLQCVTGAGFKVPGQAERGRFYQNFALWLLECPWCAGFHWFMYMDNDPGDANAEASNRNGNKGIVTTNYKEWTQLTTAMAELNRQIPAILRWFDARNNIK